MALQRKRISSRQHIADRMGGRTESTYERRMRLMAAYRSHDTAFGGYYSWGQPEAAGGYGDAGFYGGAAEYDDNGLPLGGYDGGGEPLYLEPVSTYDSEGFPIYMGGYEYKGLLAPIGWVRSAWDWLLEKEPTAAE